MADILIRIEKPKNCFLCRFFREVQDYDGTFACCMAAKKEINLNFDDCFFPSLPEGHGKLIDIKDVKSAKFHIEGRAEMYSAYNIGWNDALDAVCMNAPTIVPAEAGEAE